jgi:hypothetical protein
MAHPYRSGLGSFWLLAAALAGAALPEVPNLIFQNAGRDGARIILLGASYLLLGGIVGALAPSGTWRWGFACVCLLPVVELASASLHLPQINERTLGRELLPILIHGTPLYLMYVALATIGCYVVRSVTHRS